MEALGQLSTEKADKPAESRRLKFSWPPRSELEDMASGSGASTTTDGDSVNKPVQPKWPPEEGSPASAPEQDKVMPSLCHTSSLKESSLSFKLSEHSGNTLPAPPDRNQSPPPAVGERQLTRENYNRELQYSSHLSDSSREQEQKVEVKSEKHHLNKQGDNTPNGSPVEKDKTEQMEEEDGMLEDETPKDMSSPEGEAQASRLSQDVGFWDIEEEQRQQEVLSVEEMIKQNRYYEDEEDV